MELDPARASTGTGDADDAHQPSPQTQLVQPLNVDQMLPHDVIKFPDHRLPVPVRRNTDETRKGRSCKRPLTGISSNMHQDNSDFSDQNLPVTLRRDSDGTQ